jgi:hypothetical protein
MFASLSTDGRKLGVLTLATALLVGATVVSAAGGGPDPALRGWLGQEYTVSSSTLDDHMPTGGKLTFVFDASENVVRVCTRTVTGQRNAWRMDFANPCSVTMIFAPGTRYCSLDDVKAGNAEVLSSCHRLRSRDVAMRPAKMKGTVELNDMIAFLVQGEDGKPMMSILVDSPARVTDSGIVVLKGG